MLQEDLCAPASLFFFYVNTIPLLKEMPVRGFRGGSVIKNPPVKAGNMGLILIWEDPTCHRATKPVHHNYWVCALATRRPSY